MADMPAHDWRAPLKRRLSVAAAVFLLWAGAIEARLVHLQVVKHAELSQRAASQQNNTRVLPATRGEIRDREGRVLAYSVDAESISVNPRVVGAPARTVAAVCEALRDCSAADRQAMVARLADRTRPFHWLRRQVSPEQAARVAALEIKGLEFVVESRRWYPNRELAAHVLGFVGIDHQGLAGIEARYDSLIRGEPGTVLIHSDARDQVFSRVERPPTAGGSLELTIDTVLQHIAERELRAGVQESGAAAGSAVVMDPHTGEILALANYPTFNPNAYRAASTAAQRNRAVQDAYEPGSTFKVFTAAAAIEEGVVTPQDRIDVSAGLIRFEERVITDVQRYGVLSFEEAIVRSSNVGAIKVGLRVGAERLIAYVRRFGFGRVASPDFWGGSPGIVWDAPVLNDSALASVSMGYQVAVTPLQMAAAASVVANGGTLIEPRLVRGVVRDGQRLPVPRTILDRPIGARTAAQLTSIMEGVVTRGTGRSAEVPGYTVAGKTGTTQKYIDGRYSRSDYYASFVGFVPSRNPRFTIVVVVDSPRGESQYGGVVAAPIFQRIAAAALRQYAVPPTVDARPPLVAVRGADPSAVTASAADGTVRPARVSAVLEVPGPGRLPDLRGLGAREASRLLAAAGVTPRLVGSGLVVDQQPAAGTPLDAIETATVWLDRQPIGQNLSVAAP